MAQTWTQDPKTGDYQLEGGAPTQSNSLKYPAFVRLKVRRGQWMYAPDAKYGSDFHTVKKRPTARDNTLLESVAARALQPIVDDGRAQEITVETTALARNGVGMNADITEASGRLEQLTIPSLGV